jgi:hypothetical protein
MQSLQTVALACSFVADQRAKQASLLPPIERVELVEGILRALYASNPKRRSAESWLADDAR